MANKIVKKQILETVENQIRMNDPKCTGETFQHLITTGISRNQAKEMIAAVFLEEMYYILKDKVPFNEKSYEKKLNDLKNNSITGTVSEYGANSIQELIQLSAYNDGTFPEEVLQEIIRRKNEAIPFLLDILKEVLENPKEIAKDGSYFAPIYAVYLLAQFRAVDAYPIFIEILKLPDELPHDLFGDAICEAGDRILASICGNALEPIKELIINEQVDEYVRAKAVDTMAKLALQGFRPREEILEYYRKLLKEGLHDKNQLVMAEVVSSCNNLYPDELMEEIRMAYSQGLVDDSTIDLDFVEETLKNGKEKTLSYYKNDPQQQLISDAIEELKNWACFKKDDYYEDDDIDDDIDDFDFNPQPVVKEFKVGRNDPCSCGSGKKYKKCCGK